MSQCCDGNTNVGAVVAGKGKELGKERKRKRKGKRKKTYPQTSLSLISPVSLRPIRLRRGEGARPFRRQSHRFEPNTLLVVVCYTFRPNFFSNSL